MKGIYARLAYWSGLRPEERSLHELRALSEIHPEWVFCHVSAAAAHGLAVSYRLLREVHVATSRQAHCATSGHAVRHCVGEDETVATSGVLATSIERTVFDCARSLPFGEAMAVADSAIARGATSRGRLVAYAQGMAGYRGVAQARRVAALADGRAESGGESIARAAMIELGFEAPELQAGFRDPVDGRAYRVDFLWRLPDGSMVAGELDGREKYASPAMAKGRTPLEVLTAERRREARLTALGIRVVRFSFAEVRDARYLRRLLEAYGIPRAVVASGHRDKLRGSGHSKAEQSRETTRTA
jgi:hypothetical protein